MKNIKVVYLIVLLILLVQYENYSYTKISAVNPTTKIKGMTVVAAQSPIRDRPIYSLKKLGVNSIALLPYGFYKSGHPEIYFESFCTVPNCPFGAHTQNAIVELIQKAKASNVQVMLKPHIWAASEWCSELTFETEADWLLFEKNYTAFIMKWVQIANRMNVELFCIGSELYSFVQQRPNYWSKLIQNIRNVYFGKITYGANWSDYQKVDIWDELDYIGLNTYFPLLPDTTPSVQKLETAWKPIVAKLDSFSKQWKKPILFTEWGYLCMDGCAFEHWQIEQRKASTPNNEQAQANAIEALLKTFLSQDWWAGGFQWKWYADSISSSCEYDIDKDYTPEGKIATEVLKKMYHE